jgi:hypothetical protein
MPKEITSFGVIHTPTNNNLYNFYKVGDNVVLYPECPGNINHWVYWKKIKVKKNEEVCTFGKVIALEGFFISFGFSKKIRKKTGYKKVVIQFDDGKIITCSPLYYRLIGRSIIE